MIRTYTNLPPKKVISGSCAFTEEEYISLFNTEQSNKLLVPALKKEFSKKGLKCSNAARSELEHFAFNNTIRKSLNSSNMNLIPFYKLLVSNELSYSFVKEFVVSCRKSSKDGYNSPNYRSIIVGIILSDSKNKELEFKDFAFKNMAISDVMNGEYFLRNFKTIPQNPNCSHCSSTYWDSALKILLNCRYCSEKAVEFSNDCIVKLGRPISEKIFSKFLVFAGVIDQLFIYDILKVIFLFYVKL